jgi:hypothetical protein
LEKQQKEHSINISKYFKGILSLILQILILPIVGGSKILAVLLGLPIVAIAIPFGKTIIPAPKWEGHGGRMITNAWEYRALPSWAQWLWGSDKYGAYGNAIWTREKNRVGWWSQFKWLALRNPVSNMNRLSFFNPLYDPNDLDWIGKKKIDDVKGKWGFQLIWDTTRWWIGGVYIILPYGKTGKCFRLRIGDKLEADGEPRRGQYSILVNPLARFGS